MASGYSTPSKSSDAVALAAAVRQDAAERTAASIAHSPSTSSRHPARQSSHGTPHGTPVHRPAGWGAATCNSTPTSPRRADGGAASSDLMIKDLDSGRSIPFEHADILWQPMLVRDLDANILLPFSPDSSRAATSQEATR